MLTVTATELQRHFGRYRGSALQEPVAITADGQQSLVLLSAEEYRRLKRRDQEAFSVESLSDAELTAIAQARVPESYAHLDGELD
ncbi:type II toxin-antitoxin system Phd/YefM family antitoxin [uncultured Thiodictyon sp.]|uniref:type II toxin-antitoxin system Phd/YefM family antitoxin n=1 Tax=uncultured Thiodictyon sp. TaxID=1846217 RepID=UPI0025E7BD31|nr:type II toxin-antitoxin system Phd/YefM family antitoxin [uncultured Thiodictyon sp.]